MASARKRALADRLTQVLGPDEAATLMALLSDGESMVEQRQGIGWRLDGVGARLDGVESRLDRVESRLAGVESRLNGVESRLDRLYQAVIQLSAQINTQTRTFVLSTTASVISAAGLAFAAARFV